MLAATLCTPTTTSSAPSTSAPRTHLSSRFAMDITSNLTELGKTPVAVISASVKFILDIPWTLEYLYRKLKVFVLLLKTPMLLLIVAARCPVVLIAQKTVLG
ncbi:hypothetical protein ACOSQ2_027227 [Xanthoceras sorbifolium]